MIIDGHAHALAEFADPKKITEIMDSLKVDKIVLCPGGTKDVHSNVFRPKVKQNFLFTNHVILFLSNKYLRRKSKNTGNRDLGNNYVHELAIKIPTRIIQFYWINFFDKKYYEKLLSAYEKWHFKGLKLHQCVVPFKNDSYEMDKLTKFATEKKLPIFIHIYSSKEADKLISLARKYPKTNFIFAHMMGLENVIRKGRDLKNIFFDISTYYIISEKRIKKAIKIFGSNHILLGSDTPFGFDNLKNNIEKIENMDLSKTEKENILGNNISKLLNIK